MYSPNIDFIVNTEGSIWATPEGYPTVQDHAPGGGNVTFTIDAPGDEGSDDLEVSLLTAFPDFSPTTIIYQPEGQLVIFTQGDDEGEPDTIVLSRDMAIELIGALNVYIRGTAE